MTTENKCCGNCKMYKPMEEIDWMCTLDDYPYDKDYWCDYYKPINNGWTEITPDNVDSIYDEVIKRVIVTDGNEYKPVLDWHCGLSTMAKCGGYYYYILPELKIE